MPVSYDSNKKAGMTSEVFQKWFFNVNNKFRKQKRKIILFIDSNMFQTENLKVLFIFLFYLFIYFSGQHDVCD